MTDNETLQNISAELPIRVPALTDAYYTVKFLGIIGYGLPMLAVYIYFIVVMLKKRIWNTMGSYYLWWIYVGVTDCILLISNIIKCCFAMAKVDGCNSGPFNYWVLTILTGLDTAPFPNSYLCLVGMAFSRLIAVYLPIVYKTKFKTRHLHPVCVVFLVFSFGYALFQTIFPGYGGIENPAFVLDYQFCPQYLPKPAWHIAFLGLFWNILSTTIIICMVIGNFLAAVNLCYRSVKKYYERRRVGVAKAGVYGAPENGVTVSRGVDAIAGGNQGPKLNLKSEASLVLIGVTMGTLMAVMNYMFQLAVALSLKEDWFKYVRRAVIFTYFGINPWIYWAASKEIRKEIKPPWKWFSKN